LLAVAPRNAAIIFLALGWTLENLARALYSVSATSVRQALVPDRLQARVTGFTTTAGTGAFPLGTAIGGALAGCLGLRRAMLIGALRFPYGGHPRHRADRRVRRGAALGGTLLGRGACGAVQARRRRRARESPLRRVLLPSEGRGEDAIGRGKEPVGEQHY